jgi:D-lactate dehydrogenase
LIKEEKQLLSSEFNQLSKLNDVQSMQTLLENHTLFRLDNVIVTPHNAFNSIEALQRIIDSSIQNIKNFDKGIPTNVVK